MKSCLYSGAKKVLRKIRPTRDPERKAIVAEVSIKTPEAFEVPCPDLRQKGWEIKKCLT